MSDITFMRNHKNLDENQDITRKIKRMKLNNSSTGISSNNTKFALPSFNLKEENSLHKLFPLLREQDIQDTLKKSHNHAEAINKLHQLNAESFRQNKNFYSLHKSNKKRRFCNLDSTQNNNYNPSYIEEETKIIERPTKTLMNNDQLDDFINKEAEEIIKKFKESKNVEEAKQYLSETLFRFTNQTYCDSEVSKQLENLIEDNKKLKKAILLLDKKWEQNKNVYKDIQTLREEYEKLKKIHSNHIHNNNLLEYILKQNEN